ncbi:MAG TPA: efflux RND transporter periplasmic adaptor subunit [Nitrospira sp.]|nr:efflux RND transporter periplasmic adaptor subunit [Nitrospira sp.]
MTEVVRKDVPVVVEGVGTTAGTVDAQIRAKIQGYLLSRHYVEGGFVKAGDLLFKIDARTYQASYDQKRGELARAEAAYKKTQLDVARDTPLAKQGAVSQKELDDSIQANEANKASVFAARAELEKAKLSLDWTNIASPVDGIAGIANAQIGDLIMENTVLTTVSQVDPIKVLFPISEKMYLRFAERIQRAVTDPALDNPNKPELQLILADGSLYPHKGRVSLPDRQVDTKTGTITVVGYFPNPGNVLRPGQYAKVRATIETLHDALLVPQRAVQELQGIYQVAVLDGDNKIAVRAVKPGVRIGSQWVITSGLKPGEQVVVEGLQKVRSGIVVSPKPVPPEPLAQGGDAQPPPGPPGS